MPDPNKEIEKVETTTPPAPEETNEEDNQQTADDTDQSSASGDEKNEIDYKAEYERVTKQLSQAEYTIEQEKKKNKSVNEPKEETEQQFEVTDPKSADVFVSKKVQEGIEAFKREMATETIDSTLKSLTDNEDERKLIKHIYDNRIVKSGFTRNAILEDLQEAQLLANKKAIMTENLELKQALKAKNSMGNTSRGTNQDKVDMRTVTDEDKRIADRFFGGDIQRYLKTKKDN